MHVDVRRCDRVAARIKNLDEEHAAGAAQVHRLRLEDRQLSFLRFLSSFSSKQYAVFTHDPVSPPVHLPCHGVTFPARSHDTPSVESSLSYKRSATTAGSSAEH